MADPDDEPHVPERTCIVTRAQLPPEALIRFVRAPDGAVVPDLKRKLPGRGVWVRADRDTVAAAVKKRAFARALKAEVSVDPELPGRVDGLLEEAALQGLSLANKAGRVVCGFAKVEAALARGEAAALIHASEAAADGKRKLAASSRPRAIELFSGEQLSLALGRPHVIHAALLSGSVSAAFLSRCDVLARYRGAHGMEEAGTNAEGILDRQAAEAEETE
jgi:predicted RNA-binding protein YlxR (DUF448 family)